MVIGDINAKVGREEEHTSIIGKCSKHKLSNKNQKRLINFVVGRNCKIIATFSSKNKFIREHHYLKAELQIKIDHVLVQSSYSNKIYTDF